MTAEEIEMLQRWALELGLPEKNAWRYLHGLNLVLQSLVIERRTARARRERDLPQRAALEYACAPIGVRVQTHGKRLKRWMEKAWEWVNFD